MGKIKLILAASILLVSGQVGAALIDFEEIDNSGFSFYSGTSLDSQGFNFSMSSGGRILHWADSDSSNADPGGVTYSHNNPGTTTTLTEIGGGAFDLTSIDFANVYNTRDSYAQTIRVTGFYDAGGSIQTDILTDALPGLETFTFNWIMLSSVTWTETSDFFLQLDNVALNESISPVPAPAAIWLFGTGLLGLIGVKWRRKAA